MNRMGPEAVFKDILYVSDGRLRRADISVEGGVIARIADRDELDLQAAYVPQSGGAGEGSTATIRRAQETVVLLPGVIDDHIHSRDPGLTHKGDLSSETRAAAAGGVTSVFDMPNVVPQTTTLEALSHRRQLGAAKAFINYTFYFGAASGNARLLSSLDPAAVPAVKLFMGSSTGGMLVDGEALEAVFDQARLPVMVHCEDAAVVAKNMSRFQQTHGDDPPVRCHPAIRSREACLTSTARAVELARKYGRHLHVAHVSTQEELALLRGVPGVTAEACLPHLLFCDEDYASLGALIKCNPAVKTRADRDTLRRALTDGGVTLVATDHAPHLLSEKEGGCQRAASGIPMVQFSLVAMMELVEEGVLPLTRLVELMCHAPARLFGIVDRGFIREGMKADLVMLRRAPWTLSRAGIVSPCGWSPLEGRSFHWRVEKTFCNGRLIYDKGEFVPDNAHAQPLRFRPDRT